MVASVAQRAIPTDAHATLRRKCAFLSSVACFFSLSGLLLLIEAPVSVIAAPVGVALGALSLLRIRSGRAPVHGQRMAIVAIIIGTVAFVLSLLVVLSARAT